MSTPTLTRPKYRNMRQSTIGDFDICQLRAQFNVSGISPHGGSEATVMGTAYHAGLEAYYLRRLEDPAYYTPSTSDIAEFCVAAHVGLERDLERNDGDMVWDTSKDEAHAMVEDMVRFYFDGFYYWPDTFEVVAVEHEFCHEFLPGWSATGTADLVLRRTSDNFLVLDDHKTTGKNQWSESKASARANNQGPWYSIWIQQDFPEFDGLDAWFSVMKRVESSTNRFKRFQCEIQPRHQDAVLAKATSIARLLDLGIELPPNQSSNLCSSKYCDAWSLCPYGAALL